ncbi:hypothetical protein U9M48_011213 [Paspalum notatum var. saurae]|uniref:BRX domain-containing protein n=1 Tax=Paspalum notatum var. saurae TaxID=547442 RepID=A0AAQ3WH70_PASNO
MVLKLSGSSTQRRGGSPPPPRGRATSLYRSGYYRPGVVQDDMAVPPATYLGGGGGGGGGPSSASSTPASAWDLPGPEGEAREWVAQVEPGVQITFVSLPGGAGNDLKRIRFSREMYDKWQAQKWWGDNNERIMELYNVRRFSRQVLPTPPRTDDAERESFYSQSQAGSMMGSPAATPSPAPLTPDRISWGAFARPPPPGATRQHSFRPLSPPPPSSSNPSERAWQQQQLLQQRQNGKSPAASEAAATEAARTTTSSRDDVSISNASEMEVTEWIIQDQPGVYITVRELADGSRELRRVRFSRERFAELNAKLWWEENKERIQAQYL